MKISLKVTSIILCLISIGAIVLWGVNRVNSSNSKPSSITKNSAGLSSSNQTSIDQERIIYQGDPPYLTELPILDGNLFFNHSDDFLLFGGTNIREVRFSAGTGDGSRATIGFQENAIAFLMTEQPYIEFSYQKKFYSLQILSRPYFFTMDFREIASSSIALIYDFN